MIATINSGWTLVKDFFKSIEPYQPLAATISILSKAAYKSNLRIVKENNIRDLGQRLKVVRRVERDKKVALNQSETITYLLQKERSDQFHIKIAMMQLASLFFPHPGSNFWNSSVTLLGRLASIEHSIKYLHKEPCHKVNVVLGVFAMLGTGVSLLKQIGAIESYTPLCHGVMGLSFVSMGVETALMVKNWFGV